MVSVEELVDFYAGHLEDNFERLSIKGFPVERKLRSIPSNINDDLKFGILGVQEICAVILASAQGAEYKGMPIKPLLIPILPGGSLYADEHQRIGTSMFFTLQDGVIIPCISDEPVVLDALLGSYGGILDKFDGPVGQVINPPMLYRYTDSKLGTKEDLSALESAGIHIPAHLRLERSMRPFMEDYLEGFIGSNSLQSFVVKGDSGSQGRFVRIYTPDQVIEAMAFIDYLFKIGNHPFLEERIIPKPWKEKGCHNDWNLRAIVTFSEEPKWVDSEVRYRRWADGMPVNVSNGASAEDFAFVARKAKIDPEAVQEKIISATKALFGRYRSRNGHVEGFLGWDAIIEGDQEVYALEINSGAVGGFSTLARLRKSALSSIADVLLPAYGEMMLRNHSNSPGSRSFHPIAQTTYQKYILAYSLTLIGAFDEAEILEKDVFHSDLDRILRYSLRSVHLVQQKKFGQALPYLRRIVEGADATEMNYVNLAYCLMRRNRDDEASSVVLEGLSRFRDSPYLNLMQGRIDLKAKDLIAAEHHLKIAIVPSKHQLAEGDLEMAHCLIGSIYRQKKKNDLFIKHLKLAYDLLQDPDIAFELGQALHGERLYDEASKYLEAHLQSNPENLRARMILALSYEQTERMQEALSIYELVLQDKSAPDLIQGLAHSQLAQVYVHLGDKTTAKAHLEHAVRISSRYNLADIKAE